MLPSDAHDELKDHGVDLGQLSGMATDELVEALAELEGNVEGNEGEQVRIFCRVKRNGFEEADTFRVNRTWEVNDDLLTCFNFAEGFRLGGATTTAVHDNMPDTYVGVRLRTRFN